jgi:hypothetical protein
MPRGALPDDVCRHHHKIIMNTFSSAVHKFWNGCVVVSRLTMMAQVAAKPCARPRCKPSCAWLASGKRTGSSRFSRSGCPPAVRSRRSAPPGDGR